MYSIEYLTIKNINRDIVGICDNFSSVIWESVYNGVGVFEIYAEATEQNKEILAQNNFVTRADRPRDVGIIENVIYEYDMADALMIKATGRFAKSILDRRIIYNLVQVYIIDNYYMAKPVVMTGKVELICRSLLNSCIINPTDQNRKISFVKLGALRNLPAYVINEDGSSQTTYGNLLEITDGFLKDVNYSAYMSLADDGNLYYNVFAGVDRTATIIFSQDFDNLIKSNYQKNNQTLKTIGLIGGSGEGTDRKYTFYNAVANQTGINRREVFIDGSSIKQETGEQDDEGDPIYFSASEYKPMLQSFAKTEIKNKYTILESYTGEIDITANDYKLGVDYNVGDIVRLQDKVLNIALNQRIYKATEVQDSNGYNVTISFDSGQ